MIKPLNAADLIAITTTTLRHYNDHAASFWEGTKDHDVRQNYDAFLSALPARSPLQILDLGCGPGRDLHFFRGLGHAPTGLDGSEKFCEMARNYSGCPVLQQNFLALQLEPASFDGVFANAVIFHVPSQEMPRVLGELRRALRPGGILFSSNPRGQGEGWSAERYATYLEFPEYEKILRTAGFEVLQHFYRPAGKPLAQQPWLAVVSQAL